MSNHIATAPKRKGKAVFLFWTILFLLLWGGVHAQDRMNPHEAKLLRTAVKERAAATTTISSDFVQYKHLDFLSSDIESKGTLAFKAPDMVKWAYTEPFSYAVLFKDQKLYINDDGKKSDMDLGSNKVFKQLNQLITASIRGDMFDEAAFDIAYFKKDSGQLVHFVPKDQQFASFIKAFHIVFTPEGDVAEIKMIEPSDDYTQIVFSNRTLNQQLPDALFAQ